jgi:hypothetical protein
VKVIAVTDYISVDTSTTQLVDKRFCFFFTAELNGWVHDYSFVGLLQ